MNVTSYLMKQLKMNKFIRASVYIRVSSNKQVKKFGLAYQEREAKTLITKNMWSFVKVYEDRGISGTCGPDKRKGLQYLLDDASENNFDKVVIFSVDRLGRTQEVVNIIYNELVKNDVEIISCTENVSDKDKIEKLVDQAYVELKIITRRMVEGKKERIKLDGECGGLLPYGYCRENKKIVTNDYQSHIIRYIYKLYHEDKKSMNSIAIILTTYKIPTSKGKSKWNRSSVKYILDNHKKYIGEEIINNNLNNVCWDPILDKNLEIRKK